MTGVWQPAPVRETLELIASLHPRARRLVVVDSTAQTGADLETQIRARFQRFAQRMALVYLRDRPLDEVTHALADTPDDTVGLFVRQVVRTRTERMTPSVGMNAVVEASRVPIYGMVQTMVRRGAVGGYVFYNDETSKAIAGMVLRVADGTPVRECHPIRLVGTPMFDWRALQRWHIDERRLPAQSVVVFRPPSVWRDHRGLIRRGTGHRRGPTRPHCQPGVPSRETSESGARAPDERVPDDGHSADGSGPDVRYEPRRRLLGLSRARPARPVRSPRSVPRETDAGHLSARDGSSIPGEVRAGPPFR